MRDQSLWTWHIGAGAIILVLLGLHMGIMHLDKVLHVFNPAGGDPVEWANVAARARSTGFTATYVLFLGAALFHGFYGVRNILFELNPRRGLQLGITWVLILGGLALFALGTWSAIAGFQHVHAMQGGL